MLSYVIVKCFFIFLCYNIFGMPKKTVLKLPKIDLGPDMIGQRIARLRKIKGLTQIQLAKKMGLIQSLISDYETGRLRLYDEMVARFAIALEVSADDILGINGSNEKKHVFSLKIIKRMLKLEQLPYSKQKPILNTIDALLKSVEE